MIFNRINKKNNKHTKTNLIIGAVISGAISVINIPILTWYFQAEQLGVFALFMAAISLFTLIGSLGFEQSLVRNFYSEENKWQLFVVCLFYSFIGLLVLFLLTSIYFQNISDFIVGEISREFVLLLVVSSILLLGFKYTTLILRLEKLYLYYAITSITQRITFLFMSLCFSFLLTSNIWNTLIYAYLWSLITGLFLQIFFIKRNITIKPLESFDNTKVVAYLKYSLPLLFSSLMLWLVNSVDKYFIKLFSTTYDVGMYSVALKIAMCMVLVQQIVSLIWVPTSMQWLNQKKTKQDYSLALNFVVGIIGLLYWLACLMLPYVKLIIAPQFHEILVIVPILLLYPVFYIISEFTVVGILYSKNTYLTIYISIIVCIFTISVMYYFINNFQMVGAALGLTISYFVFLVLRTYISIKVWQNILTLEVCFGVLIMTVIAYYVTIHDRNSLFWIISFLALLTNHFKSFVTLYKNELKNKV